MLEINSYYRLNMSVLNTIKIVKIENSDTCIVNYIQYPNLNNCRLNISQINSNKLNSFEILEDKLELGIQRINLNMLNKEKLIKNKLL